MTSRVFFLMAGHWTKCPRRHDTSRPPARPRKPAAIFRFPADPRREERRVRTLARLWPSCRPLRRAACPAWTSKRHPQSHSAKSLCAILPCASTPTSTLASRLAGRCFHGQSSHAGRRRSFSVRVSGSGSVCDRRVSVSGTRYAIRPRTRSPSRSRTRDPRSASRPARRDLPTGPAYLPLKSRQTLTRAFTSSGEILP